jgi:adducin
LRCKLACVNRLIEMNSWSSASNSITVRISQEHEHFLTNPFGLNASEISASSLLKVDMQGNVIDPGSTNFSFNRLAFGLHSAVHSARPDIKAIVYLQHAPCVAVSSLKSGLLTLSAESALLGGISYHEYRAVMDQTEREQIANCIGAFNKVLVLRNHGLLTGGDTLEEALFLMQNAVAACEVQLRLSSLGAENLHEMSEEAIQQARSLLKTSCSQVQSRLEDIESKSTDKVEAKRESIRAKKWKIWDLEFESKMRMLDNAVSLALKHHDFPV